MSSKISATNLHACNTALPLIMHIDLNCCFAIIEQQANRLLRGRAVAVSAYNTPRGMIIAASYEAKRQGIKLGVNNKEAREIDPKIIILTPTLPNTATLTNYSKKYCSNTLMMCIQNLLMNLFLISRIAPQ